MSESASPNKPAENSEEPALNGDERAEVEPCLTAFLENLDTYLFRHPEVDKIIRPPPVRVNSGRLWGPGAEKKRKAQVYCCELEKKIYLLVRHIFCCI